MPRNSTRPILSEPPTPAELEEYGRWLTSFPAQQPAIRGWGCSDAIAPIVSCAVAIAALLVVLLVLVKIFKWAWFL